MRVHPFQPQSTLDAHSRERPFILVAEDDADFAALLADTLEEMGCEVDVASCGAAFQQVLDAVQKGHAPPYDLIITDVNMPRASGLAVVEHLRSSDWATPVIVVSAYLSLETTDEALRLGAEAVFSKPIDLIDLERAVDKLVPGVTRPTHVRARHADGP